MNLLFVDVETTGLDNKKHGVVELAVELYKDGVKINEFNEHFFDKRSPVSLGALKVNKKTVAKLYESTLEDLSVMKFIDWLIALDLKGPTYICGHNVQFDVGFIKAMLAKYGVEDLEQIVGYKYLDTFTLASALILTGKLQTDNNATNLGAIAKGLGIDLSQYTLHTAKDDVRLTVDVFFKMLELLKKA